MNRPGSNGDSIHERIESWHDPLRADRPELSPPAVLEGQATIFEIERDWRPLAGALLPVPLPPVKALLADFARYTTENRWHQKVHEPMARVLRVAATRLGADTVFREDELRAMRRVFGGTGRIRGLLAFLDQRVQLVPSPARRNRHEAFVQRTITAFPPRISDELGTWVGVLRGASRPHHRVTDYATMHRYLIYLATPLADWTTRYTTLRQVTEADVTAAVTAVKGPRAHERAVAIRSLFRALKHTKLVFVDPTRGLRITRQELLPTTLAPDRLAGRRRGDRKGGGRNGSDALAPLTVAEIRRLLATGHSTPTHPRDTGHALNWSRWRRRHQATARRCHYHRRTQGHELPPPDEASAEYTLHLTTRPSTMAATDADA